MQVGGWVGWLVGVAICPLQGMIMKPAPPAGYLVDIKTHQALPYFTEVTDTPVAWDLHLVVAYRQPDAHMGL